LAAAGDVAVLERRPGPEPAGIHPGGEPADVGDRRCRLRHGGAHRLAASWARDPAYLARAAARFFGRRALGPTASGGFLPRGRFRATVTLCTSVGPSARPRTLAPSIIWWNGISLLTPSAPCTCSARCAMSCSTPGISTLMAAMSLRTLR